MNWDDVLKIITATITSIGAGGAIIFALSNWLGRLWAQRILESEKNQLASALEKTKSEIEIIKETTLRFQNDKLYTYRAVIDVIARILSALDAHESGRLEANEAGARFDEFNEQRIRIYGYLAIVAPQPVMDAQDVLIDNLLLVANGQTEYKWEIVRENALALLNAIRIDVGIDKSPIYYNGAL
ncbi:hypothetical protein [Aeromonas hydrophila]|uniref:hypothetical protein n=1 Tax=Aeromonas hydrophila TaxID=644 RepID=UPI000AC97F47|nr:hypothetical protein [Aeromonas hydrophila]QPR87840.1 hypothetical protein I6G73_20685 [Aeromonas hydrophila]UON52948.1 hypothetical protein IUJ49_19835 [Aeromonas hydrophila]